jgi:type II secretory pathway component PulF
VLGIKRRINAGVVVLFTEQLAAMLSAQLPVYNVLASLARETMDNRFKGILEDVVERLEHGQELGDILDDYPEAFSTIYVNMVQAGMRVGKLDGALEELALYLKQMHETRGRVISAITYPAFVVSALVVIVIVMSTWILPNFKTMFANFGKKLPLITQWFVIFADIIKGYGIPIFIAGGIAAFLWVAYINTEGGRLFWDRTKLGLPVIGELASRMAYSRFLHTMAVLIKNEVPVIATLRISGSASGNRFIEGIVFDVSEMVQRGISLKGAFQESGIFPGIVLQMIAAGEEGGALQRLLYSAAHYYDKQVEMRLGTVVELINPALTVFVGAVIAGMMVAMFLPIFSLPGAMAH